MKLLRNLAVAGCGVLLLTQCASKDEIRDLSYQIRAVNQKVEEVRSTAVDQMQKRQASSVSRIDETQTEIMQLRAMLEEKGHQQNLSQEQTKGSLAAHESMIKRMQEENVIRMNQLEERLNQLERNLDRITQVRIKEAEDRAREAAQRAEEARKRSVVAAQKSTGGVVAITPEARKEPVEPAKKIEQAKAPAPAAQQQAALPATRETPAGGDLFSRAMDQFKSQKYDQAYKGFEEVLAQNPRGDEAAETLFYMGESLYARGEYDLAILDYQKVISNHASHPRTPAALLKQGMSFEKLTDHETAKIIYKKLMNDYPNSAEASTAGEQLNTTR